ncbi:MAG: hypothetical protein IJK62_00420 [Bacteroidales bacterium]|nr:hypothetical protein [Bacteroidales bacterium]
MVKQERIKMFGKDGLSGQNAKEHQFVISDIMFDIYDKKNIKSYPELKVELKEKTKNGHQKYVIPDIVIYNKKNDGVVFVEICREEMVKSDSAKLKKLMQQHSLPNEGFVYDYENHIWYKVNETKGKKREENSHSEILDYDFVKPKNDKQLKSPGKSLKEFLKKQLK